MEWTEERTNLLKTLWLQGQTASQIAERLGGVTRNAVIGKAHRLGLSSRPSPIRQRPAQRSSAPAPAAPRGTQYFAAHVDEARQVVAQCAEGTARGDECANAEQAVIEAEGRERFKKFMGN